MTILELIVEVIPDVRLVDSATMPVHIEDTDGFRHEIKSAKIVDNMLFILVQ